MLKASASKHPLLRGEDILRFLRSFEGGAATFAQNDERWTLWLPEMAVSDHPLTPASQVFFPVILRHGQQAIAIRFLYDCSTGKVRYYTSAIPDEIARLPEFENAVSELFRHSLPVEPMRERKLARGAAARLRKGEKPLHPRPARTESLAESSTTVVTLPPAKIVPAKMEMALAVPSVPVTPVAASEKSPAEPVPAKSSVRLEIGPRVRSVLIFLIFSLALVAMAAMGIYAYLQSTEDPGVLHHKLQVEEMRLREGR